MGSFNVKCFASSRVIQPNEECKVCLISKSIDYTTVTFKEGLTSNLNAAPSCYYDKFWSQESNWVDAFYDDYGRFKLKRTKFNIEKLKNLFIRVIEKELAVVDEEEFNVACKRFKEVFDTLETKDDETRFNEFYAPLWELLSEKLEKNKLFRKIAVTDNLNEVAVPFAFCVVSKVAYDLLKDIAVKGLKCEPKTYLEKFVLEAAGLDKECEFMFLTEFKELLFKNLQLPCNTNHIVSLKEIHPLVKRFYKEEATNAEVIEALLPRIEDGYFFQGVNLLNLELLPVVYAGQDYDNEIGKLYAKFVKAANTVESL